MEKLLTRDAFRHAVFTRDNHKCVICGQPGVDAHHILERRLWDDGGYYLSNGATLCEQHHLAAESTDITVEDIRLACGITKFTLPSHLYDDQVYDKWGNPFLPNGQRLRGDLFWDESVQKILANHLHEFTGYVKYPSTYHLPWSGNINDDDRVIQSTDQFKGQTVSVTVKMDGENTTMYRDYIHARSIDGRSHPSRDWVKNFHSSICHEIPQDWRICGENLYAVHSITYNDLPSYFLGFSVWNDRNVCLSRADTAEWFQLLGIKPVQEIYYGEYNEDLLLKLADTLDWNTVEGYVVRNVEEFAYKDFKRNVAKFVRKNHVQTVKHWMWGQAMKTNAIG